MIPPTCARDAGLINAVLNVYFDPLTAKRRSLKEDEGVQNKKKQKKTFRQVAKVVLTRNNGGAVGWGAGEMHVTHEDRRGTRRMESATDTDSRDNNHGDVGSQTALCTFHESINI